MRRTASEVIRELEMRVARLERQARKTPMEHFDKVFSYAQGNKIPGIETKKFIGIDSVVAKSGSDLIKFLDKVGYQLADMRQRSEIRDGEYVIMRNVQSSKRDNIYVLHRSDIFKRPNERVGIGFDER